MYSAFEAHKTHHPTYIYESQTLTEPMVRNRKVRESPRSPQEEGKKKQYRVSQYKRTNFTCVSRMYERLLLKRSCVRVCVCVLSAEDRPSKTQTKAVKIALLTGK